MLKSSNIQNRTLHFNHYLIRKKRSKTNDKQNLKKHFKEKYDFSGPVNRSMNSLCSKCDN